MLWAGVSTLLSSSETEYWDEKLQEIGQGFHTIKFFWNTAPNTPLYYQPMNGFHTIKFFWNILSMLFFQSSSRGFHTIKFFWNIFYLVLIKPQISVSTLLSSSETVVCAVLVVDTVQFPHY